MGGNSRSKDIINKIEAKFKVLKRAGQNEDFKVDKIKKAIRRALVNGGDWPSDDETEVYVDKVANAVCSLIVKANATNEVSVEDIQKYVIQQFWIDNMDRVATHYTLYKEERRKAREADPIEPEIREMIASDAKHFGEPIQYFQLITKFARWNESKKRRETWQEVCDRVIGWFKKQPKAKSLTKENWDELYNYLYTLKASPAMRVIQMAGPPLDRCNVGVFNCSYLPISDLFSFVELLYILMQGTGAGFSVESHNIEHLPRIKRQKGGEKTKHVIEDSTEGWCDALKLGLETWFEGGDVEFDFSKIRAAGAKLLTKGGRSCGPDPLKDLLRFSRDLILKRQGKYFTELDCHDMACMIGKIVQVGGVRRAALISLSDLSSSEMREAKSGSWWQNHVYRSMANNSAVYDSKPSATVFMEEWLSLAKSGSGERGIFNRDGVLKMLPKRRKKAKFGTNPCAEIILRPYEFCNLTIVIARPDDTPETLKEKIRVATIFGTLQASCTNFKYIRQTWRDNCEEEALLGVDITGQMDCPLLRPGSPGREKLLEDLKEVVAKTNEEWAKKIGINRAAADTCVKPSGDSSQFFNCGSGIHAWFGKYFIRRVRERKDSPVARMLMDQGVPWMVAPEDPSLLCFEFPRKAPEGALTRHDQTAIDQLENWLVWKKHFADHSVSATVYIEDTEWFEAGWWVYKHFDEVSGVSFLPRDNGTYTGTPYEEIGEEEYRKRLAALPEIDWSKLVRYETEDMTVGSQTYACTAGGCDF